MTDILLEADFEVDVTSGSAPLTVSFTDTSLGSPTFWEWDFNNDGTINANQQSPMFTYATAGTYVVKLRVSRDGLSDELIRIDPLIVEPVADFQVDVTLGNAPLTVSFTDTSLGSPTFWEWDFNNEGTIDSNQQSPMFTYATAGTYVVKLRVSRDGLSDELIRIDPLIVEPVADFQVDITLGNAPLTVSFTPNPPNDGLGDSP